MSRSRRAALALALAAGGCAHGQRVTTERRPDGIVHLRCETSLADCLYEVENVCDHKRFVVLRAVDGRDLKGVVPSQALVFASEAYVRCGELGEIGRWGADNKALLATPVCAAPPAAAPAPPIRACTPGATQACVGPAGCAGGQACTDDGSRFGPCDCGAPPPAPTPAP